MAAALLLPACGGLHFVERAPVHSQEACGPVEVVVASGIMVHRLGNEVFRIDRLWVTVGPITFETLDLAVAKRFDCFDDVPVSIVVRVM